MPGTNPAGTVATLKRLQSRAGEVSTAALGRMEAQHEWYTALPAQDRSWVGLVAQAGIAAFIDWYRDPSRLDANPGAVFDSAPKELTRSISLRQTLDLVRTVIDEMEAQVESLAAPGDAASLQLAMLHFSREMAFAAAQVYAQAAETRGAWDARLESLVVDAVLRGEADDAVQSRVSALGWEDVTSVVIAAGDAPSGSSADAIDALRSAARRHGFDCLAAVQGHRLVAILGHVDDGVSAVTRLQDCWAEGGPIVVGPIVPHVYAAGRSARSALAGHTAARAWPAAPRPCSGEELLAERVLTGDERARRVLIDRVHRPLSESGALLPTARTYLELGGLEATARELFIHPNTVRYRLGRIADLTGYDLATPHDAFTARVALSLARLDEPRPWRRLTAPD
ncbi:PucR family transcriptional regulator [Demetria terragena]|uniref:PucR family transcriptional regulator n=1 Tax=Demetria terragena TaxID=63959 RepID=UPI000368DD64|nr:helix-turn-helix domain-containing protein [Demetria terragena]